jgi:2-oxoisovalerate dehydrogenase E1 component
MTASVASPASARILRHAYMTLARELDSRFENLLLTGRISKWYSEVGNEATTVPAGLALGPGDVLCSLHRDLGAILAYYLDPARTFPILGLGGADERRPAPEDILYRLACQLLGKGDGFSQGVERSFHYAWTDRNADLWHLGMISHLGSMIPVAAGAAFARKFKESDRVAINFIGDGGTSTGDFHEGLNMAAVWKLPLVLVVENNRYAFSTPTSAQYAARQLADRGLGYGIPGVVVDGNDPDAVATVLETAIARARAGEGPTLVEAMLGRMRGHSEGDDSLKVVPADELAAYQAADPVPTYQRRLLEEGVLDQDTAAAIATRCRELVEEMLGRSLDAAPPAVSIARRSVFAEAPAVVRASSAAPADGATTTYVDGLHQALREELERNPDLVLMGQDIGVFEGAFRITKGLWARWPKRVLDTPIAESGTIGIASGAALLGVPVVVEMQFGDFVTCGFNQIVNLAAKAFYRWQLPCPIVVRLPVGAGVGAGPFHSQSPEAWFAHAAGLKVICPATARDAKGMLKAAIRDPNPVIVCEHKFLYRRIKEVLPEGDWTEPLGEAAIRRSGSDVTLIGWGATTWTCLEAAETLAQEGIAAEVVDLRSIVPFDEATVLASVKKTGRAIVVHEAQMTAGFGGEVVARIAEAAFDWLDAPVRRIGWPDRPVPYSRVLEADLIPTSATVVETSRSLVRR